MDDKEKKILEILKKEPIVLLEKSQNKLLSIITIHNRIKKLNEEKGIKKYTIDVDQEKLGKTLLIYLSISANLQILKSKN